jgi:hypothetical protein
MMAFLAQCNNVVRVKPAMPIGVDCNNVVTFLARPDNTSIKTVLAKWTLPANVLAHAFPPTVITLLLRRLAARLFASAALAFDDPPAPTAKSGDHCVLVTVTLVDEPARSRIARR